MAVRPRDYKAALLFPALFWPGLALAQSVANPNNAVTPSLVAGGGISISGNTISANTTLTGDVSGTGSGSVPATLATVNSNLGQFESVTVNAKGLVTGAAHLSGDITTAGGIATLPSINPNVGRFQGVTVNAKGQVIAGAQNAFVFKQPGNSSTTNTSAFTMAGFGAQLTPATSGVIDFTICGVFSSSANAGAGGGLAFLRYGTGTPPISGATSTGTSIGLDTAYTSAGAFYNMPFCVAGIASGFTLGVPVWFDLAIEDSVTGTFSVANVNMSAHEI